VKVTDITLVTHWSQ